jgi:acetyl-CoA synthetase
MPESAPYPIPAHFSDAHITPEGYATLYQQSIEDPDAFWAAQAEALLSWHKPWRQVSDNNLDIGQARWFVDAQLNVSVNCIDRHLPDRADQTAIVWEGDQPDESQTFTYQEL